MSYNTNIFQYTEGMIQRISDIIDNDNNKQSVILLGDSIVERIPEKLLTEDVLNHGVSGMTSSGLKHLIDTLVLNHNPKEVYIHIGTNDLGHTVMESPRNIALNITEVCHILKRNIPEIKITLISTLPCVERKEGYRALNRTIRSNDLIEILNRELQEAAKLLHMKYIDVNQLCFKTDGSIDETLFEDDGLHINEYGYNHIFNNTKF